MDLLAEVPSTSGDGPKASAAVCAGGCEPRASSRTTLGVRDRTRLTSLPPTATAALPSLMSRGWMDFVWTVSVGVRGVAPGVQRTFGA